jgi:hypothetical protein
VFFAALARKNYQPENERDCYDGNYYADNSVTHNHSSVRLTQGRRGYVPELDATQHAQKFVFGEQIQKPWMAMKFLD